MTSAAPDVLKDLAKSPTGLTGRLRAVWDNQSLWSLADQAAVSIGNFTTAIFVLRGVRPEEGGLFSILLDLSFFLINIHAPLLTYPLSVRGASSDVSTSRKLTCASLWLTGAAGLLLLGAGVVAGVITGRPDTMIWVAVATLCWQLQEVMRRALMARLRVRAAVLGDSLSYVGQGVGVWLLWYQQMMTLDRVMMVIAITSLLGMSVQIAQAGLERLSLRQIKGYAVEFWQIGRWLLAGNLTGIICIPAYSWVLVGFHGLKAGAVSLALFSLLKISHPIMTAVSNMIVPAVARAQVESGRPGMWRAFIKECLVGAVILVPLFSAIGLAPRYMLHLAYHNNASEYAPYIGTLQVIVVSYVFMYLANMTTAYLTAIQRGREVFNGHVAHTAGSLAVGLPLTAWLGVVGSAWGGGLAIAARLITNIISIRRLR